MRERLINRSRQGDLGEASAIERLRGIGAVVFAPIGSSPDFDLIAALGESVYRIQVKTSLCSLTTKTGDERHPVRVATSGGNRSWNGIVKRFDARRVDYLFVLLGNGRRWFIPASAVEAQTSIQLGGAKYSEYEIEVGRPIQDNVYGPDSSLESCTAPGEYPSGQRMAAVNRPAKPSQVRILSPPSTAPQLGQTRVWGRRRVTIPFQAFEAAELRLGDRLRARVDAPGWLILERIDASPN